MEPETLQTLEEIRNHISEGKVNELKEFANSLQDTEVAACLEAAEDDERKIIFGLLSAILKASDIGFVEA